MLIVVMGRLNLNIPLVENNTDYDCCPRKYRRAILNVLHSLKPKYSLEIGSHCFQSSAVWSYWFEKNMPDGKLITCDVAKWTQSEPPKNVYNIMVYPHIHNIRDNHGGIEMSLPNWENHIENSHYDNMDIIEFKMDDLHIDLFDLSFVDGDHARESFLKDLCIVKYLTKDDGYILIDDINDRGHAQYDVYRELKSKGNVFYEFEDWNPNPGMALIKNKDLTL